MKPNWTTAPEWAAYASQEQSGSWYYHELQPRFQELTGEWISKGRREILPKVDVAAKDTLEGRPYLFRPDMSRYRGLTFELIEIPPDAQQE